MNCTIYASHAFSVSLPPPYRAKGRYHGQGKRLFTESTRVNETSAEGFRVQMKKPSQINASPGPSHRGPLSGSRRISDGGWAHAAALHEPPFPRACAIVVARK
ncbi:hypothetical protein BaRGS_00010392 [Batillaria attramentaria]|uniref:Uncharacterized protein n=1 Tax=Batillaria attramentaria TaxID=370345 RepID=A0ABD0LH52_9CAEN